MYADLMQEQRAAEVRYEPAPGQRAFVWDSDPRRESDRHSDDLIRGAEKRIRQSDGFVFDADEIPAEWITRVKAYARWAVKQGWGDHDELLSDAMLGLLECVQSDEWQAGRVRYPNAMLATYVRQRLRTVRKERHHWRRGTFRTVDPEVMAGRFANPDRDDDADPDAEDFWRVALETLSPRQAEAVTHVYRHGRSYKEAGEEMGCIAQNVHVLLKFAAKRLRVAIPLRYLMAAQADG